MRAVGIKALKNKLSEYVRVAAGGETVLVTDRDRVVAELGPPQQGRATDVSDALLADVVRRGWLRPPIAPSEDLPPGNLSLYSPTCCASSTTIAAIDDPHSAGAPGHRRRTRAASAPPTGPGQE